jgi:hypothetical protein
MRSANALVLAGTDKKAYELPEIHGQ